MHSKDIKHDILYWMHKQKIYSILWYSVLFVLCNGDSMVLLQPEEVRKKGPRGVIELTDCWISPSNEDDVTFSVQTGAGDIYKLRGKNKDFRMK